MPPLGVTAACSQSEGSHCDGKGSCVQCIAASDCGINNACQTWSCTLGMCGVQNTTAATPVGPQVTGDCLQVQCNGFGAIVTVPLNTDTPPDDGNQCTAETCAAGVPQHPVLSQGSACAQNSGKECNANGVCVQCLVASECGTDGLCLAHTCSSGSCGITLTAAGTPVGTQVPNDCQQVQCNASGGTQTVANNTDVPLDDGNPCTSETCVAGVPSHPNVIDGTACTGGTCQGGTCVPAPTGETDLVVVRVGDGAAGLTSAAALVNLVDYKLDGTWSGELKLPVAVGSGTVPNPLTLAGSATSEGALARSFDGHHLTLAGYAAAPGTAAVNATTSGATNRVIGLIGNNSDITKASIDTTTAMTTAFSAVSVRGATSNDGSGFWVSGNGSVSTGGIWYIAAGTVGIGTQLLNSPANARWPGIFGPVAQPQLFFSSTSTTVTQVGPDLPKTSASAIALTGLPVSGGSPYGFALLDRDGNGSLETLYIADDGSFANGGGVQKWTYNTTQAKWLHTTTFTNGLTVGCRGLTAWITGSNATIAATTNDNKLVLIVDDGSATPLFSTLATAPTNTAFRGVALKPK